ncbi:calpain family cysteine protease [Plectosphaerella plurivora]|uniref:Calpain family cysteine protease n=1 Tax=Plectosphaerella plurivora TaxID=936078 RepID=A0A9P8VIM9_9PEZI|nr:calpain family cysteine protease [Plectosphaerella plurivora]
MHGYSSSEESDDPRRPTVAYTPPGADGKNKRKKPRPAPQATINNIWKTFQKRKFTKAVSVLPFDPVAPSAGSDRPNELLNAGYERAVDECRRKVQKIIKECRRVNSRYRDPGWDLDWDLKWEKGNCLNSLGTTKWDISRKSIANANSNVPKAVKRVHEIFDKPTFLKNPSGNDIKQGSLGDCWLIASLTSLANVPGGLQRVCVEYDTRIGIYGFVFYRDGEWIYSIIDDKLYLKSPAWDSRSVQRELFQQIDREDQEHVYRNTYQTGSQALFFGQCKDQNETWVPLLEKAYAKAHGDYASLAGGWTGEATEDLTGGVTTEMLLADVLDLDSFWDNELMKVNEEFMFGFSTGLLECGYGDRDGISEGHAYVLLDARVTKTGVRLLKLRNPWGKIRKGLWEGAWSDGSKEWTKETLEELDHRFGNDSVFWITYEDFLKKFQHFDRTRLFRDPSWRCAQRWIGVDVPWRPHHHEKFQIKLTKDSPLVLSLSQLDNRYFKGLSGQYSFRLNFRIHEKDRLDAEDYIVRSHGNYLMDRSVSVEIPDMPAGEYSVFVSVTAERDLAETSVEDVVKRECKNRIENDKLAQVGQAYDLAHSKGTAHLEEVARLRQKKEQEKASGCRVKHRRKEWERRHLLRQIKSDQAEKNAQKKEKHRLRKEEEQRIEEEERRQEAEELAKEEAERRAKEEANKPKEEPKEESKETQTEAASTEETPKDEAPKEETSKEEAPKEQSTEEIPAEVKPSETTQESETKEEPAAAKQDSEASSDAAPTANSSASEKKSRSPSPPRRRRKTVKHKKRIVQYDGDSSDSPIDDWEQMYSDDDLIRKTRSGPANAPLPRSAIYESEDEDAPPAWNAICIAGIRVYSMDENLELVVVLEDEDLSQGGMGKLGERDLDDAQTNAGGEREIVETDVPTDGEMIMKGKKKAQPAKKKAEDEPTPAPAVIVEEPKEEEKKDETPESNEDSRSEKSTDSSEYDKLDSGASTPGIYTPLESNKELC